MISFKMKISIAILSKYYVTTVTTHSTPVMSIIIFPNFHNEFIKNNTEWFRTAIVLLQHSSCYCLE